MKVSGRTGGPCKDSGKVNCLLERQEPSLSDIQKEGSTAECRPLQRFWDRSCSFLELAEGQGPSPLHTTKENAGRVLTCSK